MATIYTKTTGVATNAQDLLTKLSTFLTANGFALEFSGDNIISSVNLGKKFIFSKDSKYYYFAASDNNAPFGNNSSYISKSISAIGYTISKTLNTSNNWFANNPNSNYMVSEIKPSCNYFFYVNGSNIIIVIKWAANQYSFCHIGDLKNLQAGNEAFFVTGSSTGDNTSGSSAYLAVSKPFTRDTSFGYFDGSYIRLNDSSYPRLIGNWSTTATITAFPCLNAANSNEYVLNKTDNPLNGVSVLWDFKLYKQTAVSDYNSLARVENIFLVNFLNHTPEQQYTVGSRVYDVFPLLQKETPQTYANESNGMGFAIKLEE